MVKTTKKLIARPATRQLASQRCREHTLDIKLGKSQEARFFRQINMRLDDYCAAELARQAQIDALRDDDVEQ